MGTNGELAGSVRGWRHRLRREEPRVPGEFQRRRGNVTQEEMAEAVGVSVVWYSNLERGVRGNYSAEFLDVVALKLRLSVDERTLLHLLAVGRGPPPAAAHAVTVVPDRGLNQVVSGQRWPTYVFDRYCRIVSHNEPCESYFPWLRDDPDYPRWVLTSADARQRLVRWEHDWAAPLLAHLRVARALHPRDSRLAGLIDGCLSASPDVRRVWDDHADHQDPAGSRRGMRLSADQRETTVDLVTLTDLKPGGLRVVTLIPAAEPL